jgi:hypothetical protein
VTALVSLDFDDDRKSAASAGSAGLLAHICCDRRPPGLRGPYGRAVRARRPRRSARSKRKLPRAVAQSPER